MQLWTSKCKTEQGDTNSLLQKTTPRVLNIFDLIVIGLGSSLAIGTSVLIGELIKCVSGPAVVASIFLAGITALVAGLCLAEFGVQFLKVDSTYSYSYCWGNNTAAFIFGWALILKHIAGTASVAKGIINFTDTLTDYKISDLLKNTTSTSFSGVFPYFDYFSFTVILFVTILIAFGLKDSLIIRKLFTICGIVLCISVIVAGTFGADVKNWEYEENTNEIFGRKNGFVPFGGLVVVKGARLAFYGFLGFDIFSSSGNEIKKRKKNLPLAILATIFFTLVIFSGTGIILTLMLPYTELNSYAAVPLAFEHLGWIALKWVAVIAAFLVFQTSFFGVVFPLPRIIHAMANDGLLFNCLGNSHRRFKTPVLAIITGGFLAAVGAGIFSFRALVNLTIIGALFIYTILAINVILLRYFPKFEGNENEFLKNSARNNSYVSLKAILRNCFNFKEKHPTNLTKNIILGNLVLFCICSVGLGVIFNVFHEFIIKCTAEAIVPGSILLCIVLFNIISMCCQPKSQKIVPFKVPMFPFIPCLSIFLNFFLISSFDSITWILFCGWMIIGVLPYFFWRYRKYRKGELSKTSLYEINRTNAMKLNESIWKIKLDKKSFYEGAINTVFSCDFDDNPNEEKDKADAEVKKINKETSLQRKQDEIIRRAESDIEQIPDQFRCELQLNFTSEDIDKSGVGSEKVHWECVAEIHSEEKFSPENIALEIVDDNYNFLSEVTEEMSKNNDSGELVISVKKSDDTEKESAQSNPLELLEKKNENLYSRKKINELEIYKEKLLNEIDTTVNINKDENNKGINERTSKFESKFLQESWKETKGEIIFKSESTDSDFPPSDKNQQDEKLLCFIVETFYEAHQGEMILQQNNVNTGTNTGVRTTKPILDEQNKIKDFKEKLNQLLKNQMDNAVLFTKNSSLSKSIEGKNSEISKEVKKDEPQNSIQTLNKSQIKDQLELLLARKPPTRPSLKSSFNITLKEAENESEFKEQLQLQNNYTLNDNGKGDNDVKSSSLLANSIKEKILSLKSVESEPNDICC